MTKSRRREKAAGSGAGSDAGSDTGSDAGSDQRSTTPVTALLALPIKSPRTQQLYSVTLQFSFVYSGAHL